MTRDQILEAIRSATGELGRVPGARKFHSTTGISRTDLWNAGFAKYSEAVEAAGLVPNRLQGAHDTSEMLRKLAVLTRQLGKFPSISDLKAARSVDKGIPSYEAYFRLGGRSFTRVPEILLEFCRDKEGFADVIPLIEVSAAASQTVAKRQAKASSQRVKGYVYLAKLGRDYKVGRSNDVARRRREISLLLPQELEHIHIIETDDPAGIERYWHERFKDRHVRGEWYRLTRDDIAAFKRRRYQ